MRTKNNRYGFTLIELLVVIAIIGILAAIVLAELGDARVEAQRSTATQQLNQIRTGVFLLWNDTGKGPNGCPFADTANPEVALNNSRAGLSSRPPVGNVGFGCEWTAEEVAKWNGPYFSVPPNDPWGGRYIFDPDFVPYRNCPTIPEEPVEYAIVSWGPDGNHYTCDDVFLILN